MIRPSFPRSAAVAALLAVLAAAPALAAGSSRDIASGAAGSVYDRDFCPVLARELAKSRIEARCQPAPAAADAVQRVADDPRRIGYAALDVLAREAASRGGDGAFVTLRSDDVRECVFAVTRNAALTSFGELQANAARLRFIVPPADSGSAATFRNLQRIDADGLGKAGTVVNAADIDEAIQLALSAEDTVALFVQMPDPASAHFETVDRLGGFVLPVLDRAILREQSGSRKVYFAQETEVGGQWLKPGTHLVTACTPLVVFTGHPDRVPAGQERQDQADLIATVQSLRTDQLYPAEGTAAKVMRRSRELSAEAAERIAGLIEEARTRAKPLIGKATEAIAAARPAWEMAKELTARLYEKAKEDAREMAKEIAKDVDDLLKGRPGDAPPKQ